MMLQLAPPLVGRVSCMDAIELMRLIPAGSVDLIVTSPPYDNLRTYNGYSWNFEAIAHASYRVLKQGGVLVWVVGDATVDGSETLTSMRQAIYFKDVCGFNVETMIYEKDSFSYPSKSLYSQIFEYMFILSKGVPKTANLITRPSVWAGHMHSVVKRDEKGNFLSRNVRQVNDETPLNNVWRFNTGSNKTTADDIKHPAMFPEVLAERHILTWSNPGDIVLDYFGGSGTTAKVARKNNRQYITGDISREYCDLMEKRLSQAYTPNMFEQPLFRGDKLYQPAGMKK